MVHVKNYALRERKDGETFIALELAGGLEMVQSAETGKFYATIRKCSIPSTLDEPTAQMMVGQKIEGEIVRVQCDPYDFTNPRTGEVITLTHTYAYRPNEAMELIGHTQVRDLATA